MSHSAPADPPEAALAAADHVLGDVHASVVLLEYGDYACPSCLAAEPRIRHLIDTSGERLCLVFRHFPLMALHPQAELAAEAAEAAAAQGQFWPMHRMLFAQAHHLMLPSLAFCAASIGLDMIRFNGEMADRIYTQRVHEHRRAGERSGVRTTPTFLLNGRLIDTPVGFEALAEAVQAALKGR